MTTLEMPATFPVASHTDNVGKGSTFVVIKGLSKDGLEFVPLALERGASRIVCQKGTVFSEELQNLCSFYNATIEYVDYTRKALAYLSAHAAGYPAQKLKLYAVTGTKGKTSSVWMLYHILCNMSVKVALISTVGNYIGNRVFNAGMTTPQPDYIHQFFTLCVESGVTHVVMETAAQATTFSRLETLEFDGLIFTNLEQEHGELYSSLDIYFEAKRALCDFLKPAGNLVVNYDGIYGKKLASLYSEGITFSFEDQTASYYCTYTVAYDEKTIVTLKYNNQEYVFTYAQFIGFFNAYNFVGVCILLLQQGFSGEAIQKTLASVPVISGRMEKYRLKNGATVIIDYAHTPSSFEALFKTLVSSHTKLSIVFGAGGGKDTAKRPIMGKLAAEYGHRVYITNDNPRYDEPLDIALQIYNGIPEKQRCKVIIELDRQKAIERAIAESDHATFILLLGKGPDEYQLIQGQKLFFSERFIALEHQ